MKLLSGGLTQLSTVDYPGHVSSVLYLCDCPYSCPFCQNHRLLKREDCWDVETDVIVGKIADNFPFVDSICITGGEPLIQVDSLAELLKKLHLQGVSIKLDTNGFYPNRLRKIIQMGVIDYIAMDIKAPLNPEQYSRVTSRNDGEAVVEKVKECLRIISHSKIPFEPRTTVVPNLIEKMEDIEAIALALREYGFDFYVLQQFCPNNGCLDKRYERLRAPERDYLYNLALDLRRIIPKIWIRTMENGQEKISA